MKNNQLKWLIQGAAGSFFYSRFGWYQGVSYLSFEPPAFYFPIDTGLRYDFEPLTLSFTLGFFLTPLIDVSRYIPPLPIYLSHTKWTLALGWKFHNKTHITLTLGSFRLFYGPLVGVSASFPLKQW